LNNYPFVHVNCSYTNHLHHVVGREIFSNSGLDLIEAIATKDRKNLRVKFIRLHRELREFGAHSTKSISAKQESARDETCDHLNGST